MGKRDKDKSVNREQELESELEASTTCLKLYHEEMIKSKKAFDVLCRTAMPNQMSDLLAELYELRQERNEEFGADVVEWLDAFKEAHNLGSDKEAIRKMIDIFKAWNVKLGKDMDKFLKEFNERNKD